MQPLSAFGPFVPGPLLGSGGMATVWKAVHGPTSTEVALKVVSPPADPGAWDRWRVGAEAETRLAAALDHHAIIGLLDAGSVRQPVVLQGQAAPVPEGALWIAMELASQGTLDQRRPRSWPDLRDRLGLLLDALAYAHARGVIHRDLKPANVLLCGDLDARPGWKLSDFGLARQDGSEDELGIAGTPRYMAPEQTTADARRIGPWTDLYALGVVGWELVTGEAPFYQGTAAEILRAHRHQPLPGFRPAFEVPPQLEDWLQWLLEKRPLDRCPRAAEAARALWAMGEVRDASPKGPTARTTSTLTALWTLAGDPSDTHIFEDPVPDDGITPQPSGDWLWRRQPLGLPSTWASVAPRGGLRLAGAGLGLWALRASPTVGWEAERDQLWAELGAVLDDRKPRVVVVSGPSATGHDRLARWLGARADELGAAQWISVKSSPAPGPHDGLTGMVVRATRTGHLQGQALREGLQAALADLGQPDDDELEVLVGALGLGTREESAAERLGTFRRLLRLVSARRPLVAVFETAHESLEVLAFADRLLAEREAHPLPALVLVVVDEDQVPRRPGVEAALQRILGRPGGRRLAVHPLNMADSATFAAALGFDPGLAAELAHRAGGQVGFMEQLAASWALRGSLVAGPQGMVLHDAEDLRVPDDLRALWSGRLWARLPEGPLREARVDGWVRAALLGLEVDLGLWGEAITQGGGQADLAHLEALVHEGAASWFDGALILESPMVRELLLELDPDEARTRSRHDQALAATRLRSPDRLLAVAEHLLGAGRPEEAAQAFRSAQAEANRAGRRSEVHLAGQRWRQALVQAGLSADDPRWAEGERAQIEATLSEGRAREGYEAARRLVERAQGAGWSEALPQAFRLLATGAAMLGRYDEARTAAQDAIREGDARGDAVAALYGVNTLGDVARLTGAFGAAVEAFEEGARRAEALGHVSSLVDSLVGLGASLVAQGDLKRAEEVYRQALAKAEATGKRSGQGAAHNGLGELARKQGRYEAAAAHYRDAIALFQRFGEDRVVIPRMNLGLCLLGLRDDAGARRVLLPLRHQLRAAGRTGLLAATLAVVAAAHAGTGDTAAFDEDLDQFEVLWPAGAGDPDVAWSLDEAGARWAERGDPARASRAWRLAGAQWTLTGHPDRSAASLKNELSSNR